MSKGSINLNDGRSVYIQARGLKVTTRGRVTHPAVALAPMSKGERRRVRKSLRIAGRIDLVQASLTPLCDVEGLQRN